MVNDLNIDEKTVSVQTPYEFKQFAVEKELVKRINEAGFSDIKNVENAFLHFDMSGSQWYDLGTLLWFISLLHTLKKQKNEIRIVLPEPGVGDRVWDFLIRWRFFDALRECVDDPANLLTSGQIPFITKHSKYVTSKGIDESGQDTIFYTNKVLEITTIRFQQGFDKEPTLLNKYYGKVVIAALSKKCGWDMAVTENFLRLALDETVRNSFQHSNGSFVNVAMLLDSKSLTLGIADNGMGIPDVLRSKFKQSAHYKELLSASDAELIKFFTEPELVVDSRYIKWSVQGTTSKSELKGLGLYYLRNMVKEQGGELRVRSGQGCVDFNSSKTDSHDDLVGMTGTMLRIRTPLT